MSEDPAGDIPRGVVRGKASGLNEKIRNVVLENEARQRARGRRQSS